METLVDKIKQEWAVFEANANAVVEKGNKAAGVRARKASLNLQELLKEFRKASVEAAKK
ncbi:MAG: histone H1 [Bacteroidaceae bacterium]|nr:histone H1 [Bacteroidales bacterium]MBP3672145.1 histone H1 [Bacteroidaceae bacterium]MBQ2979454.1 histone H1 [Bacteroidaceae bacterium]